MTNLFGSIGNDRPAAVAKNTSAPLVNCSTSSGIPSPNPIKIDYEDIADDLVFWESAVGCYVIGANPPLHVIDGFVWRIWKAEEIDKVGLARKGVYLVRMKTMESMVAACGSSGMLFDKKKTLHSQAMD